MCPKITLSDLVLPICDGGAFLIILIASILAGYLISANMQACKQSNIDNL